MSEFVLTLSEVIINT